MATVTYQFDNFYLYGAVEPTTGAHFFLELPYLNSRAFQLWLDPTFKLVFKGRDQLKGFFV